MSGMSHLEPKFRGMRRNNAQTVKVEEKRLQKLLDFIDTRMQDQRSKLRRQIEDVQQTADELEQKRHKATLQVLKNYFEVTSGRIRNPYLNSIHEERMAGVLSEPSLATVPEVDAEILAKPRSMYDRITRGFDSSRLPLIAPKQRGIINQQQSVSLPASLPNSTRSDESSTPRVVVTPRGTPGSTPRNLSTPSDSAEDTQFTEPKKPFPLKREPHIKHHQNGVHVVYDKPPLQTSIETGTNKKDNAPLHRNGIRKEDKNNNYEEVNGHVYQKGLLKPTSMLNQFMEEEREPPTPRLGDVIASKNGLSRHSSLKRPIKSSMAMSMTSLSELQPNRKQQAASKLKHALKGHSSFRIQR
ncbi:hypothetical protein DPMN_096646 [Dreissena polymorpha]|uniref:Uncharacterized protein n=1 Tax=Dreissena polymorpha TaxID=45954 RepID=A0A9D4L8R6_DREPO|nr:hypothetical protein DPMN_096646 [Dreissena polymorpha]